MYRAAGTPPGSVVSEGILLLLGQLHEVHLGEHVVLVQVGHPDRRTDVEGEEEEQNGGGDGGGHLVLGQALLHQVNLRAGAESGES